MVLVIVPLIALAKDQVLHHLLLSSLVLLLVLILSKVDSLKSKKICCHFVQGPPTIESNAELIGLVTSTEEPRAIVPIDPSLLVSLILLL